MIGSSPAAASRRGVGLPLSVIGADVRIVGDIITQGEMQIDGQVDGDITCQRLVVGEGGRIGGEVTCETIEVHGELSGKINSSMVVIAKSARVVGDITHDSLEIEAGAFMEGHCIRKGGHAKVEAKAPEGKADTKAEIKVEAGKGNGAHPPAAAPHHTAGASA
jgi:cytoskeletal protein CcmA (bactofilin family)